jgi:hypothetical protein
MMAATPGCQISFQALFRQEKEAKIYKQRRLRNVQGTILNLKVQLLQEMKHASHQAV